MLKILPVDLQKLPLQKIIIVALTIICIMSIRSCRMQSLEVTSSGIKMELYKDKALSFVSKINKLGETVSTQSSVIVSRDKDLEVLMLKNSSLSKINSQAKFTSTTTISNTLADFVPEPASAKIIITDTTCVKIGRKFIKNDKWYSIKGSLQLKGIQFDSITVRDSVTYNLGTKRKEGIKGYFSAHEPTLEIISSNPHMKINSIQNITFIDKPKWFEKRSTYFIAGIIGGLTGVYYIGHR